MFKYIFYLVLSCAIISIGDVMSYFLKKSLTKKGIYYQVYEGVHNPEKGYTTQKSIKVIGYHDDLIKQGIIDPLSYAKELVNNMEKERKDNQIKKIDNVSPIKNLGYLLPLSILKKLDIENDFSYLTFGQKMKYSLYDVFNSLIAARIVSPVSKYKSYEDVIPNLIEEYHLSYDQILDGLSILGSRYENIIEILNYHYKKKYRRKTNNLYFDCTNYYFEIDKPFEDKQKGPSKENRKEPIIGMALLLDEEQIPLSMHMYPGNQSEKPEIRKIINKMKESNNVKGKTIQVADKGLNCSKNIYEALVSQDGYIYSHSIKKLSEKEKKWIDIQNQYLETKENGEVIFKVKSCIDVFDYSFIDENNQKISFKTKQKRIVYWSKQLEEKHRYEINKEIEKLNTLSLSGIKRKELGDLAKYIKLASIDDNGVVDSSNINLLLNQEKIEEDLKYCGYNMLITSEINMPDQEVCKVYKNLWRIEESFRILKTNLVARPVYVSTKNNIYGHFLICYTALFLMRILELKILKDKVSCSNLFDFIRRFNVIKIDDRYINLLSRKVKDNLIFNLIKLPIDNYYLTPKIINSILNISF